MDFLEAVTLGCQYSPTQQKYSYFSPDKLHSCVLGAALLGTHITTMDSNYRDYDTLRRLYAMLPVLSRPVTVLPQCCNKSCYEAHYNNVGNLCAHLNDKHDMTREDIADFVHRTYET